MNISEIRKLLNSGKDYIRVNINLLKTLNIEEAILYSYLVPLYEKNVKQGYYKNFDNRLFILYSIETTEKYTGLSAFRQRSAINNLEKKQLLMTKLGQARTKYVYINENASALEKILFGVSYQDIKTAFFKYIEKLKKNLERKNININDKYFVEYIKKSNLFDSLQYTDTEVFIGNSIKAKSEKDKLLV